MKEKFARLQPRAPGGADRHADLRRRAAARSSRSWRSCARGRSPRSRSRPTTGRSSAAVKERELREAESRARQQQALTESEIADHRAVEPGQGRVRPRPAAGRADPGPGARPRRRRSASSPRARRRRSASLGEAEADRAARVGIAQALAIEEQVRAYGGPQFQLTQQVMSRFAEAIEKSQRRRRAEDPDEQRTARGAAAWSRTCSPCSSPASSARPWASSCPRWPPIPSAETLRSELRRSIQSGHAATSGSGTAILAMAPGGGGVEQSTVGPARWSPPVVSDQGSV